jgi:glutathione S-transferase
MKLFTWGRAPNPRRVLIYLREKSIDVPTEDAGEPDQPVLRRDFLDAYPHRRVPLLALDDGACIVEAMAICRYFETLFPEPSLMGRVAKEIALIEMWERLAEWEGLHAVSEVFRNFHKSFADRSLAGYSRALPQIPALVERGTARLQMFYEKFDARLAQNEFVAGDRFSVADITTLCTVDFARVCKLTIPAECTNLRRWHAAVSARPSVTT